MDRATGRPEWLAIKTGLFGMRGAPIDRGGDYQASGDDLQVPYEKAKVKDAPNVEPDEGFLSGEEEGQLYQHYGRNDYQAWSDEEHDLAGDQSGKDTGRKDTGTDTSGRNTDDAMTRSEEEFKAGTRSKEAGKVPLKKYVVTEHETVTVPVRKEKARMVREPITDTNVGKATSGPDISEEEHEMVLNEEEVVTEKRAAAEGARAARQGGRDRAARGVREDVRKERIDVEGDVDKRR